MALTEAMNAGVVVSLLVPSLLLARADRQASPQLTSLKFEVTSVKPNGTGSRNVTTDFSPGGRMTATNVTLRELVLWVYAVQPFQIAAGPGWQDTDRFDIAATPAGAPASADDVTAMARALLADRFKLIVHTESREQPTYGLVMARADGALGSGLAKSDVDCGAARTSAAPRPECGTQMVPGLMRARGLAISRLAGLLSTTLGRQVIDKTGLEGYFNFQLRWMPIAGAPAVQNDDRPSLFTALQEQLGLKLNADRGQVDTLVIDSAERPTEN